MHRLHWFGTVVVMAFAISGCGAASAPHASGTLTCPTKNTVRPAGFCLTSAERALGEKIAYIDPNADAVLFKGGETLTTPPRGYSPSISLKQADSIALSADHYTHPRINGAALVVAHDWSGSPASGPAYYYIDITPPGGVVVPNAGGPGSMSKPPGRSTLVNMLINPSNGQLIGVGTS